MEERIAIIGAGAAGCFCAIEMKRRFPQAGVVVFEAGAKPLAKVAITGGGRCNLTNTFEGVHELKTVYPRGERLVRHAFSLLDSIRTQSWWEKEGVRLTAQSDGCIFPVSQDAMQIVRTLENLMRRLGVELRCSCKITRIEPGYSLTLADGTAESFDRVVVTTGGGALKLLEGMDIPIEKPVPSLFTFKIQNEGLRSLMGTVVENAVLSLAGTRFRSEGTLLLTDWGVSGPATLKLSSYAARHFADNGYKGTLLVNWLATDEETLREWLGTTIAEQPKKMVCSTPPAELTSRLWKHILGRAALREDLRWAEIGSKGISRLVETLLRDAYEIVDRCHFKEEFVTAGGVSTKAVSPKAIESRTYPKLHFAGEVLDIDAVTGGFNLQAAWSTGYTVAHECE